MIALQFHEAADLFPLDEEHIDELAADIKLHGQQVPVELCDGKIIDGRRRYTACQREKILPNTVVVTPTDPVAYVLSLNLHRRHLTPSQRAMVAARAREIYDRQAKERQKEHAKTSPGSVKNTGGNFTTSELGKARDLAGKAAGVSGTYVDRATRVLTSAVPEVVKAVDEGRMNVTTAAALASEPPEVQRKEAANPKRRRTYNSVSSPTESATEEQTQADAAAPAIKGVGIKLANEAINCLTRIPKNDALRKRGFQVVTDWIKKNS